MDSKNPLEEYLSEKTALPQPPGFGAAFAGTMSKGLRGGNLGSSAARGLLGAGTAAVGAGAVALGMHGAQKLYDAATKARDFRAMLEADQRLALAHQENPRLVNQMFSTLRTFNPGFTRDPIVAASYVQRMVSDPAGAGGVATDALSFSDKMKNPLADNVTRAAFHRAEKGK